MSFVCLECGHKFRTVAGARRASNNGCPKCNGVDIDLDLDPRPVKTTQFPKGQPVRVITVGVDDCVSTETMSREEFDHRCHVDAYHAARNTPTIHSRPEIK